MSGIALPAFHITSTKKHTVELPYALQLDLEAYRAFYKECYGADVNEPDLIREIVRVFLAKDEAFRSAAVSSARRPRNRARSGRNGSLAAGQLPPAETAAREPLR